MPVELPATDEQIAFSALQRMPGSATLDEMSGNGIGVSENELTPIPLTGEEVVTIELTEQQLQALENPGATPPRLVNPRPRKRSSCSALTSTSV
jgi:hypothetical protein